MKKRWNILSLGFLTLWGNLQAADQNKINTVKARNTVSVTVPVLVGYTVYTKVGELRRSVADLVDDLNTASDTFGYADNIMQKRNLAQMKNRLNEMEQGLKYKADIADDNDWYQFFNKAQFKTTIHESVRDLGLILNGIALGMKGGSPTTLKMPYRVADEIVYKVQNVRDQVSELVSAVSSSDKWPGFFDDKNLSEYTSKLQQIKSRLDRKAAAADAEWTDWFVGKVYKVTVYNSIGEMGNILTDLSTSLSGRAAKSSH